jgi:transcriptional regulator with XRE-family HTH domain
MVIYDPIKIGSNIRQARERQYMSRTELSGRMYRSVSTIAGWEAGQRVPATYDLYELATVLGVTMDSIMEGSRRVV